MASGTKPGVAHIRPRLCRSPPIRPLFDLVERTLDANTRVVAPIGDLDAATNPAFLDALKDAARAGRRLVVDLSEVAFMSAGALGAIARIDAFLGSRDGRLVVVCPHDRVRRLFEIAGLDESLEIVPGLPEFA